MTTNGSNRPGSGHAQDSFTATHRRAASSTDRVPEDIVTLSRQMLSSLNRTIEGDIIPRLMLAFDAPSPLDADTQSTDERLSGSVDEFVHLLLAHDASVAAKYVSTLRSNGVPLHALYLDLLAPAARRLGVMWEQDECSFTDVTVGVCRMHQVLLEFSRCFDASAGSGDTTQNALIVPVPGEQHTFGLFMVMEFLRRAGWSCFSGTPRTARDVRPLVRARDFDLIGLSVSSDRHVDTAADVISEIRRGSRNADSVILVGGRAFLDDPRLATRIGADTMASDGREAVRQARKWCRKSKRKPTH